MHLVKVAAVDSRKLVLLPWNHPKLVMHVRSILWFDRLATSSPYVSLAHQATDLFVQGEEVSS